MAKYLINEQYDVDDAAASKEFDVGDKREDYADAWTDTGNIVLIGLPGSGRHALALLLAERTGLAVVEPENGEQAADVFGGENRIIVLGNALVEDMNVQPLIHGAGKVFYLMVDTNTVAMRVAGDASDEKREQVWRELSARLATLEPLYYSVLHFILQAAQEPEQMVDDALEKIHF